MYLINNRISQIGTVFITLYDHGEQFLDSISSHEYRHNQLQS
jgi:hypothetical protein